VLKRVLRVSVSFLLVLALAGLFSHGVFIVRGADEASSSVGEADVAVRQAFDATLEAERAGANVSGLIVKLDGAVGLLAEAENAYRIGSFSEAISRAEECSALANGVVGEALSLRSSGLADAQKAALQTLTFSCVGGAAFLTVLFFVWGWFKRAYAGKLLRMKPEVASDAED
jgi:hypothetical protein